MLYMSGAERYVPFRQKYQDLVMRTPQKHIATFLCLTLNFFNLIHARVLQSR